MLIQNCQASMKLVLQTRAQKTKGESLLIKQLFNEGLEQLNLYKPDFSYREMDAFINRIDPAHHSRIMLYSHYGLAKKYDLKGIHISRRQMNGFFAKIWLKYVLGNKRVQISTTVHSIRSIAECSEEIDEILVGPVFVNSGNNVVNMSYRREIFEEGIKRSKGNVIVMGGVCEKNMAYLKSLYVKGVLFRSSIWDTLDPVKAFAKIRDFSYSVPAI